MQADDAADRTLSTPASSASIPQATPREIASRMLSSSRPGGGDTLLGEEDDEDEDRVHVRFGGPYYWEPDYEGEVPGKMDAAKDLARYAAFQTLSGMRFAGEVAVRFVGWDRSRYQWALEAVERQQREAEEAAIARLAMGKNVDDEEEEDGKE